MFSMFEQPATSIGRTAGAAGGAGLMGSLGRLMEPLDYPRQALWNMVKTGGNLLSGNATEDDMYKMLPGLIGTGVGAGLTATGVGAPLGILAGSLIGGLGQGVGRAIDDEYFQAPEVSDVTGTDNMLANMLVGAALDPLTYAGGIGGAKHGATAGKAVGKNMDNAFNWMGPAYNVDDNYKAIREMAEQSNDFQDVAHLKRMLDNPQVLSELQPGSEILGSGVESIAFKTPSGKVTTFQNPTEFVHDAGVNMNAPPPPRFDTPEMLPAARTKGYASDVAPIRVEHSPLADIPGEIGNESFQDYAERMARNYPTLEDDINTLKDSLKQRYGRDYFLDSHYGNVGYDPMGNPRITDAGSLGFERELAIPNRASKYGYKMPDLISVRMPPENIPRMAEPTQPSQLMAMMSRMFGGTPENYRKLMAQRLDQLSGVA